MTTPNEETFDNNTELAPIESTGSAPESATEVATTQSTKHKPEVRGSLAGGTWVALIFGTLLLVLLLVFILQNQQKVDLNLFAWSFQFPAGVGFLLAAIVGALIMAIVGGVRMLELRRQVKRAYRD